MKKSVIVLVVLAGFLTGSSLFAHHGTGTSYDMHKVVVVKGVITQFNFANPHSQLYFDVTDDSGKVTHWSAEMRNPRNLESEGHTRKGTYDGARFGNEGRGYRKPLQGRHAGSGPWQGTHRRWLVPLQAGRQ